MASEGQTEGQQTSVAPNFVHVEPSAPAYPVLDQPLDECKQLDASIAAKFQELEQALSAKKLSMISQCTHANTAQKRDILGQLSNLQRGVDMLRLNENILQQLQQGQQQHQQQQQQRVMVMQQAVQPMQRMVMQQSQPQMVQQQVRVVSDTWNPSVHGAEIGIDQLTNRAFTFRAGNGGIWQNCFGSQIINKGQAKKWTLRIVPADANQGQQQKGGADVVVGVVNAEKVAAGNGRDGFWLGPSLGYGYYGWNGKKFHSKKSGKKYSTLFRANDVVDVELNLQTYKLSFSVNGQSKGVAFAVDARHSYTLAVALTVPQYTVQLC